MRGMTELTRAAQEKALTRIESLQKRLSKLRDKTESLAGKVQNGAVGFGTGYVFASLAVKATAENRPLFTVGGLDPALTWGAGALLVSEFVGGRVGDVATVAGASLLTIGGYRLGRERAADDLTAEQLGRVNQAETLAPRRLPSGAASRAGQ